ncbi:MAG: YeeE/YedE family protein [Bdellovibrionales bacterium]|jgi:uncharacterized membrane protein YedE/YeeE|nr:YeeE/YedE family protein [Bdellovibrionales bacterium]
MGIVLSFIVGVVFSVGLVISGMTNPKVVTGFLDVFGQWNAALVFVMAGAVITNLFLFNLIKKKNKPWFSHKFYLPTAKNIDKKLVVGSAIFGIGWGVLGVCPGPGIVNLVTGELWALIFVGSMILGMLIHKITFESK